MTNNTETKATPLPQATITVVNNNVGKVVRPNSTRAKHLGVMVAAHGQTVAQAYAAARKAGLTGVNSNTVNIAMARGLIKVDGWAPNPDKKARHPLPAAQAAQAPAKAQAPANKGKGKGAK